jgi:protein phosphatase
MPDEPEGTVPERLAVVPERGLVLLIGASGSGKSTFAARSFTATEILSSDAYRAMVADDEADQRATPAAFDLLHRVAAHRLRSGRLSVVDATNLKRADRRGLLNLAHVARRPVTAIVFDLPEELCQERNRLRPDRRVDPAVVQRQVDQLRQTLAAADALVGEGFAAVTILDGERAIDQALIVREPGLRAAPVPPAAAAERSVSRARSGGRPARRP